MRIWKSWDCRRDVRLHEVAATRNTFARGFTLLEVMLATGIVGVSVLACCTAIVFDQVANRKAKERAIGIDFLIHYTETVKGLPFTSIMEGLPINSLYDGVNGAPKILLPSDNAWIPVDTNDYLTFHPDLLWFTHRNPQLQVTLTRNVVNGVLHDIDMTVKLSWDPPLRRGQRETVQLDMWRGKNL